MDDAGVINAGAHIEPEFGQAERHRRRSSDGAPQQRSVVSMDTRRHIDGDNRAAGLVHQADGLAKGAGHGRRKTRAKERINDELTVGEKRFRLFGRFERLGRRSSSDPEPAAIHDIAYAREFDYTIKLLGIAKLVEGDVEARVHPTMLGAESPLANVEGVYNAIQLIGDAVGDVVLSGRGAGDLAAGSAVVSDIIAGARNLLKGGAGRVPPASF